MEKTYLLILIFFSSLSRFSQESFSEEVTRAAGDICKAWFWNSNDDAESFEMEIAEMDGSLKGSHCSVAYNGRYIDCSDGETSIELHSAGANIFEGTIKSAYSGTTGNIRLTYNKETDTVRFELLEEPPGVFYLPKDVVMN